MATSAFISIAQALEALLKQDPPVAEMVMRDRLKPLTPQQVSAVVISIDKAQGQRQGPAEGPTDWGTLFKVECHARSKANVLPSEAVDAILSAVFERLSGGAESVGLATEDLLPDPRIEWDLTESAEGLSCAAIQVRIVHRTQSAQLVPWG
jgi:hypothetical protein